MKPHPNNAEFIVLEGVDGAGKGVQSRMLLSAMQAAGVDVILTREPGGSPGAEEIRRHLPDRQPAAQRVRQQKIRRLLSACLRIRDERPTG